MGRHSHTAKPAGCLSIAVLALLVPGGVPTTGADGPRSLLHDHVLVTFYGNPHTGRMGVLGLSTGETRAHALRRQAAAYAPLTTKRILPAYHLVAVIAQPHPGADNKWRRRESSDVVRGLLDEARQHGFHLVVDVQPGRATVADELAHLRPFLEEPDLHLAIDPEFDMEEGKIPGQTIGHTPAADINAAARFLSMLIRDRHLPPKVLIVHEFSVGMLPDVHRMESAPDVDLVLNMDGFGSRSLKLASYRTVMRRRPGEFAGIKLFYSIDTNLFCPEDVMGLNPTPAVVIYQ
jgi:hypothetical protein